MNIHRTAKTGCQHMIEHFRDACPGASFDIQVVEIFNGDGYVDRKVCPAARKERVDRENFWMKELRTIFPYGLNERARGHDQELSVGKLFPKITRFLPRRTHSHNNRNNHTIISTHEDFFKFVDNSLENNIKNSFNDIRVALNKLKKSTLKKKSYRVALWFPLIPFQIKFIFTFLILLKP